MDEQAAVDRILETENLTDGLEDDDANWLLDWGIARVKPLIAGIEDDDAAGEKVNQLMAVMRMLNQITADRQARSPETLAADVSALLAAYAAAFGRARSLEAQETALAGVVLKNMSPRESVQYLIALAEPQA